MSCVIGLNNGLAASVDEEDFERLNQYRWYAYNNGYTNYACRQATKNGKPVKIKMHNEVLGIGLGGHVDHRDLDGLNNQKSNLRVCTLSQNAANRRRPKNNKSGFKGVRIDPRNGRWRASINISGKEICLLRHDTAEAAARAYDKAALEYFGEFARLNFPDADAV